MLSSLVPRAGCVICGSPLPATQRPSTIVCEKPLCAWKLHAHPAFLRCRKCGRPLAQDELAVRTCRNAHCRKAQLVDRPQAAERARRQTVIRQGQALRKRAAKAHQIADGETYTLAIIPRNYDGSRPLAARRRHRLESHLRDVLEKALDHEFAVRNDTEAPWAEVPPLTPPTGPLAEVMMQACIECRGYCCRTGAEHAYITPLTMRAYQRAFPTASREEIVSAYMSHVPARSLPGCVYQHARGCALPRDMRGDTCNRHYCSALLAFARDGTTPASPRAFFIATGELRFGRAVFVAPGFVQLVRHRPTPDEPSPAPDEGRQLP